MAFWAGRIDGIVRTKISEVKTDEREGVRNVTDRIVEEVKDRLSMDEVHPPLGTIVAYAGTGRIPDGWALCAGQEIPTPNDLPPEFGTTMPDLAGRFLQGATDPVLAEGGTATHAHQWVRRGTGRQEGDWYSYRDRGGTREVEVDNWENGIHNDGSGEYPFLIKPGDTLYTSGESNLPPYVAIRYIMRIR